MPRRFLLIDVGGYSTQEAALWATMEWVFYCVFQGASNAAWGALSDRVGRRPVLLLGIFVVTVGLVAYSYPNGPWFMVVGGIQGLFDNTWALSNAIIVDCTVQGAAPGDRTDYWFARLIRAVLEGRHLVPSEPVAAHSGHMFLVCQQAHDETSSGQVAEAKENEENVRTEMSSAFTTVWVIAGLGSLSGLGVGYVLTTTVPLVLAMACSGIVVVPSLVHAAWCLPETKPSARRILVSGGDVHAEPVPTTRPFRDDVEEALAAQARSLRLIFHSGRSSLLAVAYFFVYFVLTGVWDMGLFWGEDVFNWSSSSTTIFLAVISVAPGIGIIVLLNVLVPIADYSKSIGFLCLASTFAALALWPISNSTNSVALFLIVGCSALAFGAYPTLTALLTTLVEHSSQGHLQGTLFAFTTIGSLAALGAYLCVFTLVNARAIWLLTAFSLLIATVAVLAARDEKGTDLLASNTESNTDRHVASKHRAAAAVV